MGKFFTGRNALIAILIAIAGGSFGLGYFVGKAANSGGTLQSASVKADEAEIDRLIEKYAPESAPEIVPKYDAPVLKESPPESPPPASKPAPKVISPPKTEPAKTTAAKTTTAPPKKTSDAFYTVQVGAYNKESDAEALKKKLASKGYSVYVSKGPSAPAYRVKVGKYQTKEKAEEAASKVTRNERLQAFVTTY